MSHMTNESEDEMIYKDHTGSPLMDEGNCGGSVTGGVVLKKGPWTSAEDAILVEYVKNHGEGNWNAVQKHSGLFRCGKSCRLRWANHLRPNLKKGAFTPEEERLIIELHAKMGNKWAQMAAHLPGRTDNEIKNYWNTRIKRRQRAGLPVYPPEVCLQVLQENEQIRNSSGDGENHDLLQTNSYEIPDVIFDSLKANQGVLPYVPELPAISASSILMEGLGSSQYYGFVPPVIHCQKRLRESAAGYDGGIRNEQPPFGPIPDDSCDITSQSFGFSFPYDPDPRITKNLLPSGDGSQGHHSLLNGNFSASKPPTAGALKLELPSLQYPETDFSSWDSSNSPPASLEAVDAFIQSPPPSGTLHSDCLSPRNSGLLDALLHEAKALSAKNQPTNPTTPGDKRHCSAALDICGTKWEEYGECISPLGNSAASIFSECTPLSVSENSFDENPPGSKVMMSESVKQTWKTLEGEKKESAAVELDLSGRPDALLGSCCFRFGQSAAASSYAKKDQKGLTTNADADAAAESMGDDLGNNNNNNDYKKKKHQHMASGNAAAALNQGWGFGACTWNNMPPVFQMSELP